MQSEKVLLRDAPMAGLEELLGGMRYWRISHLIGVRDLWNYLSQVLIDCTSIFVEQGSLYRNQKMNFSVSIYAVVYKNTIMLAHNMIIIAVFIVAFGIPVNWYL